MNHLRTLAIAALCLVCILGLFLGPIAMMGGCAALAPTLHTITRAISDSEQALRIIDAAFNAYQVAHAVSPEDRLTYNRLLATAYHTLQQGSRAVGDVDQVSQGDFDRAYGDFKVAYAALHDYLKAHGVTPIGSGLVGVGTGDGTDFEPPRLIGLQFKSGS